MIILLPILTNGAKLYSQKLTNIHFWCHLFGGIGMGAFMGMAGLHGMLSHTLYINGEFMPYNVLAAIPGTLLLIAFLAFLYNVIITVGINGLLGIFKAPKLRTTDLLPKA
jgi:cytochrome c oxidase subunit 1